MAFVETTTKVIAMATYDDFVSRDNRVLVENEALTQTVVEDLLVRSTERILSQLRASTWWYELQTSKNQSLTLNTRADLPAVDAKSIRARKNDFTDLCVYHAMYEYALPRVADFGREDDAERQKIGYYQQKYNQLFDELIRDGSWYDYDGDSVLESTDFKPSSVSPRRYR
jgi:hypothetical protein